MEDKLERYMDFAGAVPPCVTPARLEQLAARRRQRLQLRLGMAAAVLWVLLFACLIFGSYGTGYDAQSFLYGFSF